MQAINSCKLISVEHYPLAVVCDVSVVGGGRGAAVAVGDNGAAGPRVNVGLDPGGDLVICDGRRGLPTCTEQSPDITLLAAKWKDKLCGKLYSVSETAAETGAGI